jgi:hypothetical protein
MTHRGRRARRAVLDEAKEAEKEAAKRAAKEAAREVAKEAARPAREAPKKASFASTSITTGDVIRCGRAMCQAMRGWTGPSWTHQFGKRKRIHCTSCKKLLGGIEVGGRGRVRGLSKTTWQPWRGGQLAP